MTEPVFDYAKLAYALGQPDVTGRIRVEYADFQVDEQLGFDLSGEGEHVCLHIRKTNNNTDFIARQIARLADVRNMDVSYAGLKDRRAVTTQWFSVYLSSKPEPDWSQLEDESVEILQVVRHNRKIRRGSLQGNRFKLCLRQLDGEAAQLEPRLQRIKAEGVPNYFGEQRFGFDNLARATAMFAGDIRVKDRNKRSMYLSAARSAIFNRVLSRRIEQGSWNHIQAGDVAMLDGSHSVFGVDSLDEEIEARCQAFDIHPTGPLWGRGQAKSDQAILALEQGIAEEYSVWCEGLERAGLKQERRALRLAVKDLAWSFAGQDCELGFFLPSGCYATSVLRELLQYESAH